jgi:hypothetical protein
VESGKWKRRSCVLSVVIFALVSLGARNDGCDYRFITDSANESAAIELSKTETDETAIGPVQDKLGWFADDMSRLVLYSWPATYSISPFAIKLQSFDHVAAYESAWVDVWYEAEDAVELSLPSVCGPSGCATWYHAKSVDIGYCSLPLGNDAPAVSAATTDSVVGDLDLDTLEFPEELKSELVSFLDGLKVYDEGEEDGDPGVEGEDYIVTDVDDSLDHLRFYADTDYSWWWKRADQSDDLCFNLSFQYDAETDGILADCDKKSGRLTFCGHLAGDGSNGVTWITTTASSHSEERTGLACKQIPDVLEDELIEIAMGTSDEAGDPIGDQIGGIISERLSITANEASIFSSYTCEDSDDDSACPNIYGLVNARCVDVDDVEGPLCRWSVPVDRVERMPSGHEIILAAEETTDTGGVSNLISAFKAASCADPASLPGRLFHQQCAEPADFEPQSRNYCRPEVAFRLGEYINRFDYTHAYKEIDPLIDL